MNQTLLSGKIGRPFGVSGDLVVDSYSGEWDHLFSLDNLHLQREGKQQVVKVQQWTEKGHVMLVRLEGYSSPEAARRWTGWEIMIDRSQAPSLDEDEYFLTDLVGMRLFYHSREMGTVSGWLEGGAHALLEVTKTDGGKAVLPFLKKFIGKIDLNRQEMELLEDWILE